MAERPALSGAELQRVLEAMGSAAYVCEAPDGTIRTWNARAVRLWDRDPGRAAEPVRYCGFARSFERGGRLLSADDLPAARALRTGRARADHLLVERHGGSRAAVYVHAVPLAGTDGTVAAALVLVEPAPAADAAALPESEDVARLAAIVASAESAIFSMSLDGVIRTWNRSAERMFGYDASEVIGRPISIVVPDDRREESADILARIGRGETVRTFETERLARDGRRILVSLTVSPIVGPEGTVIGISKIVRDIAERKRAERELAEQEGRFRLMADCAPVLIWLADASTLGVYFNRPWLEFTGVPLEAQIGHGWLDLVHADDRAGAEAKYRRCVEARDPFTMEFRLRHHTGTYRWVQDTGQPLFLPDGTFNGYIGTCVDVHERKLAEQRAAEARAVAEEASRLKDEFLAVVSHELRTPLNAILGWARMLREGSVDAHAVPRALDTIERNARIQAQLVEDLLDVARIVSGKLLLQMEPVRLEQVIASAVEVVRPAAANKGIALEIDLRDPDLMVWGDPKRLQQAVWNLLTNAVKFTPGGGRVRVELRRVNGSAQIAVCDTGSGIPQDALPYIFDRFRQADSRTTRPHGGLGLGLAIVSHVAQAHGGAVRAESTGRDAGARFELLLPLRLDSPGTGRPGRSRPGAVPTRAE